MDAPSGLGDRFHENHVQLLELLGQRSGRFSGDRFVEGILRGIEVGNDHHGLPRLLFEGDRGDLPVLPTFLVGPGQARVGGYF